MRNDLAEYLSSTEQEFNSIPDQRKAVLAEITGYIRSQIESGGESALIFICTHNSRRSHFCQVWAQLAAFYYGQSGISTYSGGTETTAFHPNAIRALEEAGFRIENAGGDNPRYRLHYDSGEPPLTCFSKMYDDPVNPQNGFAAIMTCTDADENCPIVHGADVRMSLPYQDPKVADGTPREKETYRRRCRQIATEMCYMISAV
ncbi:MAG: protein-tyrosine-phosphatase [Balneolaceae bacterium]|nr:protein-tyrosine-phosphatase [Balneolaceae bacterium]